MWTVGLIAALSWLAMMMQMAVDLGVNEWFVGIILVPISLATGIFFSRLADNI